ncbi:MAG TPA: histidine triad nucleotide-binding protein [Gemmatimonadota bacterium]|nr:histidine triad nucleotide-binding protein [Gemmatimonadota bacterium]
MGGCIFCRIAAGELGTEILHRGEGWVAFRDLNPQAPSHFLIVPEKHIPTINELTAIDDQLVGEMIRGAAEIAASEGVAADGYRLVFNCNAGAGQSVWHVHLHLLGGRPFGWPPG